MPSPDPTRRAPARKSGSCPICGRRVSTEHNPFCSQGCRDRDLLQWLGEGYRVPGRPLETDEQD